jgi:Flp pilus assembly protein TadG
MMVSRMHEVSRRAHALLEDCRGIVAIEFAVIAPVMLLMFFGVVELSSAVALKRKITLAARTLSDLTSQSTSVVDADLANFGQTAKAILTPYDPSNFKSTITEIYIDPATLVARVQWSKALTIDTSGNVTVGTSTHAKTDVVVVPPDLKIGGKYLIWSEVSYNYKPTIGYVMAKTGVNMSDLTYTRPRQLACVTYPTPAAGANFPPCPTA